MEQEQERENKRKVMEEEEREERTAPALVDGSSPAHPRLVAQHVLLAGLRFSNMSM